MPEPKSKDIQYDKVEYQYQDPKKVSDYDSSRFNRPGGRYLNEVQVETVLDLLGSAPLSVLEAGCGTGRFTYTMARAGHQVTGLDYSSAMLETCAKRGVEEGGAENVTLVEGSIFELPFADDTFDAVLSVHVLMHLPEHDAALLELLRVVKPGGLVIFDIRNRRSLNRISYPFRRAAQRLQGRQAWTVWYATVEELAAFAAAHGAKLEAARGLFPLKPNRLPQAAMPLVHSLEHKPEGSFWKRIGHIQMVALRKEGGVV